MGIIYQMHNLHITVSTWWLYHLHNCMLWDWYNNVPNCDCEHGIWYYRTYHLRLGFSDIDRFCCIWCFLFLLLIAVGFLAWVRFKVSLGLENVPFSNCLIATSICIFNLDSELGLGLKSSTGTLIFNWDPHIWGLLLGVYLYNKLLDNAV